MSSRKINISSSSSEDDHDHNRCATTTDEKKRKRMLSNRESARRSRMKREQHVKDLNDQVTYFRTRSKEMSRKINEIGGRYTAVESENKILRMKGEELKRRLDLLEQILVSHQSSSYVSSDQAVENYDHDADDDCFVMGFLEDPLLLKPWAETSFQCQTVDGIYQF